MAQARFRSSNRCRSGLKKDCLPGGASRLASLRLAQILPVFSFGAPRQPGAAVGKPILLQPGQANGFSLAEVLISMGILTAVSLGVAQLFAVSTRANLVARGQTSTTAMAEQKLEQLRSLTWGFDTSGQGLPVSDTTSNLAVDPPSPTGGGLNPSPADSLEQNTPGYVDFLDPNGEYVGTGITPPGTATFIRRWSVRPLPTNPNNTLVLMVLVTPVANEGSRQATSGARPRMPGDAMLVSVKTRKSQ